MMLLKIKHLRQYIFDILRANYSPSHVEWSVCDNGEWVGLSQTVTVHPLKEASMNQGEGVGTIHNLKLFSFLILF